MKIRNNKELNKVFMIMGIFSIVALFGGIELGYELRDSAYKPEIKEESGEKNIESDETFNYLNTVISSNLQVNQSINPVSMTYNIQNIGQSTVYVERANIKVYNVNDAVIYETTVYLRRSYEPDATDQITFQVPQDGNRIARVEVDYE